ncbi:hypothetical protein DFH09DRAFT_1310824 [Mycena vulgaris]|nr:hypothetical protein DFH09DRAFT_1310824 [Mycena vulgaris]
MDPSRYRQTSVSAFNNCHNFTVSGGTLHVHGNNNSDESEFRTIRLGDLNLLTEVGKQNIVEYYDVRRKRTGAFIRRVPIVIGVRRMHRAQIFGSQEIFTAVEYDSSQFEQANHIMGKSGLDAEQCSVITRVYFYFSIGFDLDKFTLRGTFMADTPTDEVYLFLFPGNVDVSDGQLTVDLPPESETYYLSFNPQGIERLSEDTIEQIGLPRLSFEAIVHAIQWPQNHYNLIRECHRAKGFDPDTQDVAIELGYPLVDVDELNYMVNGGQVQVVDEVELV